MKKLLFLLFFLPFLAQSQIVVPRGTKSVAVEDAYLYTTFAFKVPRYTDTTAANLMMGHDSIGLVIQTTTVDGIWHRAVSTGTVHKWVLTGTGGGGGLDTIYVTQIGVGSPQIPLLYAVDGNLRTARLVPGVFTTPAMNLDSGVHVDVDTTGPGGAAYKAWVIAQYGPGVGGNIYTIDGKLQTNRIVSGSDTHTLAFDSLFEFFLHDSAGHAMIDVDPLGEFATIGTFNGAGVATSQIVWGTDLLGFTARDGWSVGGGSGGLPAFTLKEQASSISSWNLYWPKNNAGGTDTLATLSDVRAGSGGGGGGTATIQTITSGTSGTVTGSNYWVLFNPASALATYTLTLPASPTVGQSVTVMFGGTITAGTVVTAFTVSPNTSQTILDNTPPAGSSVTVDNTIIYDYVATNLWHRRKL